MNIKITKMDSLTIIRAKSLALDALINRYDECTFFKGALVGIALPDPRLKW